MSPNQRPLKGCIVSLSISESDDSRQRGFPAWQVNRLTLQIVAALFGQGASVVFGHDWREDGVMEAVYGFARQVQAPIPLSPDQAAAENEPLLRNILPWPDRPYLPERDLEKLSSTLRVERARLPEELEPYQAEASHLDADNGIYQYMRARGLTFLRHRLTLISHARICVGGPRREYAGRYPGIVEEAFAAVKANKPLYLIGLLGGAAAQAIDAIEGKQMTDDFCPPTPVHELYKVPPFKEQDRATREDRIIDRREVWNALAETGREQSVTTNGLTATENEELHHTPVVDRAIELVLVGLSRLKPSLA